MRRACPRRGGPPAASRAPSIPDVTTAPVGPWDRNGEDIFGSSSKSPTYKRIDRSEAEKVRDILLQKYPDVMKRDNIGENGGTLAGRMLEIYSDREMCNNCEVVLPKSH